jgi:hypothetical protein
VTTNCIVNAGSESLLHAAAWRAFAGAFEKHSADTEAPILQCKKVDATDDKVSAKKFRPYFGQSEKRCRRGQVFDCYQRDLARSVSLVS